MNFSNFKVRMKYFWGAIVAVFLSVIFLTLQATAGGDYVYVDADYDGGDEDGSSSHPYTEIQDAVDEARDEGKDVYVRSGEYEENIKLWEDVELHGKGKYDVTIKADDDDEPVIKMYDDSKVYDLTVKDGQYGILVNDGAKAFIYNCIVRDNDDDGIYIESADTDNDHKVEIYESLIYNNGWNGIYSEERKFSIKNNEILENDGDGVEFKKGSEGVFEDNKVKDNDGVGLRLTIDKSEIYVKDNTFRSNDKRGAEVDAEGTMGHIQFNYKNKFYENDGYGIVRVEKAPFSADQWNNSLEIQAGINYWSNGDSDVSHFIRVY